MTISPVTGLRQRVMTFRCPRSGDTRSRAWSRATASRRAASRAREHHGIEAMERHQAALDGAEVGGLVVAEDRAVGRAVISGRRRARGVGRLYRAMARTVDRAGCGAWRRARCGRAARRRWQRRWRGEADGSSRRFIGDFGFQRGAGDAAWRKRGGRNRGATTASSWSVPDSGSTEITSVRRDSGTCHASSLARQDLQRRALAGLIAPSMPLQQHAVYEVFLHVAVRRRQRCRKARFCPGAR